MPTRDVSEIFVARIKRDPEFKRSVLAMALESYSSGEFGVSKIMLRDYIDGTIGYEKLAKKLGTSAKSVRSMLNGKGNPKANDLSVLINELQESTGVHLSINGVKRCHHHQREI